MFTFEPGVALWSLISFSVVLVFLYRVVYPPVRKILDERRDTIELSLNESKKNRTESEKLLAQSDEKLRGVRQEAHQIVSTAQNQGQSLLREAEQRAITEYRALRQAKDLELKKMEEEFLKNVEGHVASLVMNACEKILRVDLSPEQKEKIVHERIQELENLKQL